MTSFNYKKMLMAFLPGFASKDRFHFVDDYEKLVKNLVKAYPLDEAMSRAVGGQYEKYGQIEAALLNRVGLVSGMRLVDLGCGSGRLASVLAANMKISYVGIDIIQQLLDYAKSKAPAYEFICHRDLSIPQTDASADMICAFSLFTHLLHAESYIYLEECKRVLKPGGSVIFSFLEFAESGHWDVFLETKVATKTKNLSHLNMFIERSTISVWASKLGFEVSGFISPSEPLWNGNGLGQSAVVLTKPKSTII